LTNKKQRKMTRKKHLPIALLAGAMSLMVPAANATVYRVGEAWTVGKEASYYATFQEFLDSGLGKGTADTIWVATGTQSLSKQWENSGHRGRFFGGFAGTETSIAQREIAANGNAWELSHPTTLQLADTATVPNQSILRITAGYTPLEIDGFIFDGAKCTGGAAIFVGNTANNQVLAIRRCVVKNTTVTLVSTTSGSDWGAAGISVGGYATSGSSLALTLVGCLIENNKGVRGGGCYINSSSKQLVSGCLIRNNEGGSESLALNPPTTGGGGGITMLGMNSQATIANNIVEGNTSTIAGGGIALGLGGCRMVNNTIVNNSAPTGGGLYVNTYMAIAAYGGLSYNNIFWNNKKSTDGSVNSVDRNGKYLVFNNNIANAIPDGAEGATAAGTAPAGNILETDSAKIFGEKWGTFAAAAGVDKGNSTYLPADVSATDFAGNARLSGSAVDLGAIEYLAQYAAPSKPVGLTATDISDTSFTLAWTASTGSVKGYIVYLANAPVDTVPDTQTSYLFAKPAYAIAPSTDYTVAVAAYDTTGFATATTSLNVRTAYGADYKKITVQSTYATVSANSTGIASPANPYYYYVAPGTAFWAVVAVRDGFKNLQATVNGTPVSLNNDTLRIASVTADVEVNFTADRQRYNLSTACNSKLVELVNAPAAEIFYDSSYVLTFRLKEAKLTPYASSGTIAAPDNGVYTLTVNNVRANTNLYVGAIGEQTSRVDFVNAASVSSKATNVPANYLYVLNDTVKKDTIEAYLKVRLTAAQFYSAAYNGARLNLQTNSTLNYTAVRLGVYEVSSTWDSVLWADRPAVTALGKVAEAGAGMQVTSNQPFYIDLSDYIARLSATATPDANGNVELAVKLVSEDFLASRVALNNPMFAMFLSSQLPYFELGNRAIAITLNTAGIDITSSNADSISVGDTLRCTFTLQRGYGNPQCEGATITGPDNDVYTLKVLVKSPAPIAITTAQQRYKITISAGAGIVVTDSGNSTLPLDATFAMKFKLAAGYESPISMVGTISAPDGNGEYTLTITSISANITVILQATQATGIDDVNDPVVAVQYYNIMGREVREPQHSDVVIVKRTHASGKVKVSKERWFTNHR
jgi:hypothetical protein